MSLIEQMTGLARQAREASRVVARMGSEAKCGVLLAMAEALQDQAGALQEANALDRAGGEAMGLSSAMLDRLTLDDARIAGMARGLREVAALPDPVGRVLEERTRPNGLRLRKVSVPLGVVAIIYESRPNVTADAAGLCFKAGNAAILRGGKEAMHSNQLIARLLVEAGRRAWAGFPEHAVQVVPTTAREAIPALLSCVEYIDVCMPRGGEGLIRAVTDCSKVPVIKHYKGVCHVYVDRDADLGMARRIVVNAKCQRPAVCNAMETLLVDREVASEFLSGLAPELAARKVEVRADGETLRMLEAGGALGVRGWVVREAHEQDFYTEYNDLILNVRVVSGVEAALAHIAEYGSRHSDSIVTANEATAARFLAEVDSAAVYWNASTRFTDGGEFGMGAEIGISTDKIGARGPMGLEELCSYKWLGYGTGQVRE